MQVQKVFTFLKTLFACYVCRNGFRFGVLPMYVQFVCLPPDLHLIFFVPKSEKGNDHGRRRFTEVGMLCDLRFTEVDGCSFVRGNGDLLEPRVRTTHKFLSNYELRTSKIRDLW